MNNQEGALAEFEAPEVNSKDTLRHVVMVRSTEDDLKDNMDPKALKSAVTALDQELLVVAPTETRYALLARAASDLALERLFDLKGRDSARASAIFVQSRADVWRYGIRTQSAEALANRFLPGPMTLILKATSESLSKFGKLIVNNGTIGIRLSSNQFIISLLKQNPQPLSATSANKSGADCSNSVEKIKSVFGDKIAVYVDAGELNRAASTVVDCATEEIKLLREGAVSRAEIMAECGAIE